MTEEQAVKFSATKWWEGLSPRDVATFQLFEERLCMPFTLFHRAVEEALRRPVWTHEFAFPECLQKELLGEQERPTMREILKLIPADKRIVLITK